MPKIFAIYPTDKRHSISFLNRINTYLKRNLNHDWHCFKIGFNDGLHSLCVKSAAESEAKFILFMGHGRSDCLFGSCAKDSNEFVSAAAMEFSEDHYMNEDFINSHNIELFKNKIFFSFSCNSNRNDKNSLGRNAIQKGVTSFVGFGDIPTDYEGRGFPKRAIAIFKAIITKVIKQSILLSIHNDCTVQGLVDTIKVLTTKEIQTLMLSKNWTRNKDAIISKLFDFKSEILVLGNPFEKLI